MANFGRPSYLPCEMLHWEKRARAVALAEPDRSLPRRLPADQIKQLQEMKEKLEDINRRYTLHLEPANSRLLAELFDSLSKAIDLDAPTFENEPDNRIQSVYATNLVDACCAAYAIHDAASRQGQILSASEYIAEHRRTLEKRLDALETLSSVIIAGRRSLRPPMLLLRNSVA